MKSYRINFYEMDLDIQSSIFAHSPSYQFVSEVLKKLADETIENLLINIKGRQFQIREITKHDDHLGYQGIIARFHRDAPNIGIPTEEEERTLELKERERLIEKTHFVFFEIHSQEKSTTILAIQNHRSGPSADNLAVYLGDLCGQSITAKPILRPDVYQRILGHDMQPIKISMKIAMPRNTDLIHSITGEGRFGQFEQLVDYAESFEAGYVTFELSGDRNKKSLRHRLKNLMKLELVDLVKKNDNIEKASIRMENVVSGESHIIDLLADRLYADIEVKMEKDSVYPSKQSIFNEMWNAIKENEQAMQAIYA